MFISFNDYAVKHQLRYALLALLVAGVTACGGSSNSDKSAPQSEARSAEMPQEQTPIPPLEVEDEEIPEPEEQMGAYIRPFDYPRIDIGRLQYVATTSGHDVGVRVTLPANEDGEPAEGPFPVILVQSAYNIGIMSFAGIPGGALLGAPDPFMVKRGYAMVAVDVIGGGVSEGGWEMLGAEEQSGYGDVVDWIQQQPWANGDIGVAGASYMAITALFTAQQRPDDIKAVFASVPMGDPQRGTVGTGGMLNAIFMAEWLTLTHTTSTQNIPTMLQNPKHMEKIMAATQRHVDQIDNYYLPLIDRILVGDAELTYDNEFWRVRSPIEKIHQIQAPTFVLGALNDIFQRDAPLLYEQLKDRVDSRLMLFNGDHVGHFIQALPGTEKTDPIMHLLLQWFDKHMMGMETGTENIPPVTQYVKNYKNGIWQGFSSTTDWPHPAALPERWFLHGDKSLSLDPPVEEEVAQSMQANEFVEYEYGKSGGGGFLVLDILINDGTDCSPSIVQWTLGIEGVFRAPKCFWDNGKLEEDALNYETAAMEEDYYINGPIQADLWISSTVTEAVVSVRIDEVKPNGRVIPITNGLLLASARTVDESRSRYVLGEMVQPYHYFTEEMETHLVPGEITKMQIEVFPTSALIREGNKLRVSISPSNQAQGALNLPRRERAMNGETTIHNSPEHPSSVVVLAVPLSELN